MERRIKANSFITGFLTGLLLPLLVFIVVWLVTAGELNFASFVSRIITGELLSHFISICVFPNVFSFLVFNRLDHLNSSKGVLGVTIIWALLTFIIKFAL